MAWHILEGLCEPIETTLAAIEFAPSPRHRVSWSPVPVSRFLGRRIVLVELMQFVCRANRFPRQGFDVVVAGFAETWQSDVAHAHFCYPAWRRAVLAEGLSLSERFLRRANPLGWVQWFLEQRHARQARCLVAVSEGLRQDLIRHYHVPPERVRVIPNGVDMEEFTPAGRQEARRGLAEQWGLPQEAVWLCFVAAYDPVWKGLSSVIEAIARVPEAPLFLCVAGGGRQQKAFRRLAASLGVSERIRWLGYQKKVAELYRACDIYLQPSAWEAFSLASLEAAASGLPILATRVSGMLEVLEEGVNGYFVSRDPQDLAARIRTLSVDPALRRRMGEASRARSAQFSWETVVRQWESLLRELSGAIPEGAAP